jgi:lysophospholipase L1-like esterase
MLGLGALALLELTAGLFAPPPPGASVENAYATPEEETAMRGSALLGWEAVPGPNRAFGVAQQTHINRLGTRNPEPTQKAAGTLRLMTLGDSTVYGVFVNDEAVFSSVAARLLSRGTGGTVEAINGGIPGYSSEQARRLYEHRLSSLEPDILVIAPQWSDSQKGPPDTVQWPLPAAGVSGVLRQSALYRLLDEAIHTGKPGVTVEWRLKSGEPDTTRVPLKAYRDNLRTLGRWARRDGAEPVYLILPSDRDLSEKPLEEPRTAYREAMREVATELDAQLVDAAQAFWQQSPDLMRDEVHPSVEGHHKLGEVLAEALFPSVQARVESEKETMSPPGLSPADGSAKPEGAPVAEGLHHGQTSATLSRPVGKFVPKVGPVARSPGRHPGQDLSDFDSAGRLRAAIEEWQNIRVELSDPLGEGADSFDPDPRAHQDVADCMTWAQQVLADATGGTLDQIRYYGGNVDYATRKHYLDRWLAWDPWPLVKVELGDIAHETHDVTIDLEKFRTVNGYRCDLYREGDVDFSVDYVPLPALEQVITDLPPDFYVLTGIATPNYIERFGARSGTMGQVHFLFLDAGLDKQGNRAPVAQLPLHHASISAESVVADPLGQYLKDTDGAFAGFVLWRVDPLTAGEPLAVPPMLPCEFGK